MFGNINIFLTRVDVGWMWGGCGVDVGWMWVGCGLDVGWMWSGYGRFSHGLCINNVYS